MIVRIATEGQYRLADATVNRLNDLDNRLVGIVMAKDGPAFAQALNEMFEMVRREGVPVAVEELVPSDIILPAPGTTVDEAQEIIQADGLIPG